VVLYAAVRYLTSSSVYRKLADKILSFMSRTTERLIPLLYAGFVPDFLIRFGIRIQLYDHLAILRTTDCELDLARKMEIVEQLTNMPIAIQTQLANAQHYEVPAAFYDLCLGPRKKYSSGLWPAPFTTFEESELLMLDLYCERAQLQDGMSIVDLGCGWGSLTLHLAEKYPNAKITSISNSHSQREYILETAKARGYNVDNINVITVSTIVP
jgi:cyclopropane-fatty-acyl-phospholipid synthase